MSARGSPGSDDLHAGSLTYLRKHAKALLRAFRQSDADAIHRVRAHLPLGNDAEGDSAGGDNTIARIRLVDAQFVVARELGFASWPKLKNHLETHATDDGPRGKSDQDQNAQTGDDSMATEATVRLSAIDQIGLNCTDLEAAERFYCGVLGLPKSGEAGGMKFFDCDGINLIMFESPEVKPNSTIYFKVPGTPGLIQETFEKLEAAGVTVRGDAPHRIAQNWRGRDVWLAFFRDPFGNELALKSDVPVR